VERRGRSGVSPRRGMFAGDLDASRDLLEESLRIFQEVGHDTWGWGNAVSGVGGLAALRGDPIEARKLIFESLALYGEQWNAVIITGHLRFLSLLANQLGQHERAARLAGAEAAWRGKVGGRVPDAFFPYEDPGQAAARQLNDEAFQRAWAEGQGMSLVEALAYAREDA
jgi:hypothetical protein